MGPGDDVPDDTGAQGEQPVDWFYPAEADHNLAGIGHVARSALDGTVIGVHDLNSDGFTDLAFSRGVGLVEVAWGTAEGPFEREWHGLDQHSARTLAMVDLDGDGVVELITADQGLRVFRRPLATVVEVTSELGLADVTLSEPVDILPVDLDRDGRLDLHISQWGPANVTLIQGVDGRFTVQDVLSAPEEESWTATWADLDHDGVNELFVATDTRAIDYGEGDAYLPGEPHDRLYRDVDGVWTDVAASLGLDGQRSTMGGLPVDLDGTGTTDLWLPNLGRSHALTFDGTSYTHGEDALGLADAVRRDADECVRGGDLRSCLFVSWASFYDDLDGDSRPDLLVVNGGLEEDWRGPQPAQLFLSSSGTYEALHIDGGPARSLAPIDLDGDGDLDFVVGMHNADAQVWMNPMEVPSSWTLRLVPSLSPAEGRGARVRAHWEAEYTRDFFIGAGGVAMTSLDPKLTVHGLEPNRVEVFWPSGIVQEVTGSAELVVTEPDVVDISADSAPADGTSTVRVEVTPHDGTNPIGSGATVVIESSVGTWTGPVVDLGDGRYERTLVAPAAPASARLTLGWNQTTLGLRPRVEFTTPTR